MLSKTDKTDKPKPGRRKTTKPETAKKDKTTKPKTAKTTTPKTKPRTKPKKGGGFLDNLFGKSNKEQTTQPTEPTQPTPPTEPTQPTQPTQPVQPVILQQNETVKQSLNEKTTNNQTSLSVKKNTNITAQRVGSPGSIYLKFKLNKDDCLLTTPGSLIYMRGNIDKGSVKFDSIGKAFWRSLSGQDALLTSYSGCEKGGELALGIDIPNDVIELTINPTEEWVISRGSYLCSTRNINISSITKSQGIFGIIGSGEGFILPLIQTNDSVGKFWLTCYGTFEKIELKDKEEIIIDNGYFLACNKKMDYTIEKLGKTMSSTFLGGEGYGMKFIGPGTIYTQSKNLSNFMEIISKKIK